MIVDFDIINNNFESIIKLNKDVKINLDKHGSEVSTFETYTDKDTELAFRFFLTGFHNGVECGRESL